MDNFRIELTELINKHSKENDSNTPDYILANYLSNCLDAFAIAVAQREHWYGREIPSTPQSIEVEPYTPDSEQNGIAF